MKNDEIIAKSRSLKEDIKQNIFYCLIFLMSFIILFFFPFLGSSVNLKLIIPNTVAGWLLYIIVKLLISILNMLIFYSFNEQGRLNVKNNEKYKQAKAILETSKINKYKPKSPHEWKLKTYLTKGSSLMIGTVIGLIGLSNALLNYDYISLISYVLVVLFAVIFGVVQMIKAEEYWTNEFYDYALMIKEKGDSKNDYNK